MMEFLQSLNHAMLIKYLPRAMLDLVDMGDYYREIGGSKLARRMFDSSKSEIVVLRDSPEIAPAYELAAGVRRLMVSSGLLLVFYRLHSNIEVLHIRRAEREPLATDDLDGFGL